MSKLFHNLISIPGRRINRKVLVFESDDWGSIRIPSKKVFDTFVKRGYNIAESDYNRLDTMESNEDLELLFDVLRSHKDCNGNQAVFTANMIVGNPDFAKIRESDFTKYYYEPVSKTLNRYAGRNLVECLWKQGNLEKIFHPQFHGREHVNFIRWMNALQRRSAEMLFTFENETTFSGNGDYSFMEVLDYDTPDNLTEMKASLAEGMNLFEEMFQYRSKSFIPPCYTWSTQIEEFLSLIGVKYIQGILVQKVPTGQFGVYKKKIHFFGEKNKYGQHFLIRNSFFEPSLSKSSDPVGECLKRIEISFRWNKPAIISTHRINYMGTLDKQNRIKNLKLLNELLTRIISIWPDVEFLTSDQLGDSIADR